MLYDILNDQQRKRSKKQHELDFSIEMKNIARFRVNTFPAGPGRSGRFPGASPPRS